MGTWFWLNVPICAVIFAAVVGTPLWLVFKRPDTGREVAEEAARGRVVPSHAASLEEAVRPGGSRPGTFAAYVVTDDPDGLFARATAAGATVVRQLHDTDYGSWDFAIADPEGNYRSAPTRASRGPAGASRR